ncbi:zinc finger ring fyve phd-type protein [Rutstroemia sp. NJR-2017a WRK4]|nr:zinc finger ring fyve phd-type protein [Rutstroemia sp. NJR-2017a WRK4]
MGSLNGLNWDMLEPEERVYKGNALFRWEESPGLDSRAKSCIGKHVEPCFRFHQAFHFMGKSHECPACNLGDELHYARHKDILKRVREIEGLDKAEPTTTSHSIKRKHNAEEKAPEPEDEPSPTTHTKDGTSCEEAWKPTRRREKKKAKKLGSKSYTKEIETFKQEEVDRISQALHQNVLGTKGAKAGTHTYECRRTGLGTSDAKTLEADGEDAADGGHNNAVPPPRFPTTKQKNALSAAKRAPNTTHFTQAKLRGHSKKYDPNSAKRNDPYCCVHPAIFYRLGIDVNPRTNSKERRELVAELAEAIKKDLEVVAKEQEEAAMHEEGFWRWAGRGAYENMMEYHERFDWATGAKIIPKGEEEIAGAESDDDDDDDLDTCLEDEEDDTLNGGAQEGQPAASEEVKGVDNKAIATSNNGKERTKDTEMRVREDSNVPDTTLYDVSTLFRSLAEMSSVSSLASWISGEDDTSTREIQNKVWVMKALNHPRVITIAEVADSIFNVTGVRRPRFFKTCRTVVGAMVPGPVYKPLFAVQRALTSILANLQGNGPRIQTIVCSPALFHSC